MIFEMILECSLLCSSLTAVGSTTTQISRTPPFSIQTDKPIHSFAAISPSPRFHARRAMQADRYDSKVQLQVSCLAQKQMEFLFFFLFLEMVDGCLGKLVSIIEENSIIIAGVAIGIAAIEVRHTFHLADSQNIGLYIYIFIILAHVCKTRRVMLSGQEFLNVSSLRCWRSLSFSADRRHGGFNGSLPQHRK